MNRIFASILLTFSAIAFAQAPQIRSGATVYIEPMDGYETYLAAAFSKKKVPLIVVIDKTKADYIITSTIAHRDQSQPVLGITNASISVIDPKSSQVVFAYSAGSASAKQLQSTAEDCAKHLKESIEKSEKPKK